MNSAAGSFGLSFGLAFAGAIMLAVLTFSFTNLSNASSVLDASEKQQVATILNKDAEVMSTTQLEQHLQGQSSAVQQEIIRINDEARQKALQVALLIPLGAGLIGLVNSFRMIRLPDIAPAHAEAGLL